MRDEEKMKRMNKNDSRERRVSEDWTEMGWE